MIFLLHRNGIEFLKAIEGDKELPIVSKSLTASFWEVAANHPEQLIVWRDETINMETCKNPIQCFAHELIMSSFSVENQFIPDQIGYIDQLPFVKPNYEVVYPTWRMSTDIGGIYGKTALKFRKLLKDVESFGYLLNSLAKTGQQNGLFCYSDPNLIIGTQKVNKIKSSLGNFQLFQFVAQHYNKIWLWVLFFCLWKFENKIALIPLIRSLNKKTYFRMDISLPVDEINLKKDYKPKKNIDIIIPTLFRDRYVQDLLIDISKQTVLPNRVIIVEQDPSPDSKSKLTFINDSWPFRITHHFIHRTGACYARNLAMKSVTADYIFFADDDIRIKKNLLEEVSREIHRLEVGCINLNCIQKGEQTVFHKIKQWGAFGSGTSVVRSEYALKCKFSELLEKGFGEDIDFGLQLRDQGCDIIYHPELKFTHLKANQGGFREIIQKKKNEKFEPKPSPTMMCLIKSAYNEIMRNGYKASLFLKYYTKQPVKNPFRYLKLMNSRWKISESLCDKLHKTAENR